jgi:hypothetical protein
LGLGAVAIVLLGTGHCAHEHAGFVKGGKYSQGLQASGGVRFYPCTVANGSNGHTEPVGMSRSSAEAALGCLWCALFIQRVCP